jgi:hypothetical protein
MANNNPALAPLTSKHVEDSLKSSYLSQPLENEHRLEVVRPSQPLMKQLWSSFNIFQEHHYFVLDAARYAIKGAIIGIVGGLTAGIIMKNYSNLAIRKIAYYMNENLFAQAK